MKKFFAFVLALVSINSMNAQWEKTNCPDEYSVLSVATKGDSVLAGTKEFVYVSPDNGTTWSTISNGLPYLGDFHAILADGPNIYIGSDEGIYLSTDNGASYTLADNGYTGGYVEDIIKFGSVIYLASSWNGFDNGGVYTSSDNCASWTLITASIPVNTLRVNAITIKDNQLFAGTTSGIYRSSDNGANWTEINDGLPEASINSLAMIGEKIFAGTSLGLYISFNDVSNWGLVLNGMPAEEWVTSIQPVEDGIFVGGDYGGGALVSTDLGVNWVDNSAGLSSMQVLAFAYNNSYIFASTGAVPAFYTGGVFRQDISWLTIQDHPGDNSFKVYPNPVKDMLTIESNSISSASVSLFDQKGQLLIEQNVNDRKTQINVSNLAGGIYVVKIFGTNSTQVKKFIKQ